jgi:adenylate cyclase
VTLTENEALAKQLTEARTEIQRQYSEIGEMRCAIHELKDQVSEAEQALDRSLAEGVALSQVAAAINSVMDFQPLLEMIMEKSKEVMDAESSSLMLLDEETNELTFNVATGEKGAALREIRLPVGKGIAGWVAEQKEPLLVPDAYADPRFNREADKMSGFHTRSILCVPLMIQERILGVVQVLNPRERLTFEDGDRRVFTSFADQAAIAIENARLYEEIKQKAEEQREALERERWLTIQRDKLGKYVPKSVVQEIEKDREQALAETTRSIECTILFSDIKGFTRFTEENPAAKMVQMLNQYLSAMNDVIDRYNGILDKFMGDGIMVVFLPEGDDDNHALRAVQCGIDMQKEVAILDEQWIEQGLGHLRIRVGINTGEVISGSIGASTRMDYTVVGDTVNVASRLESNGVPGTVLLSDTAYERVGEFLEAEKLEPISVKNRVQPVQVYSIDVLQLANV